MRSAKVKVGVDEVEQLDQVMCGTSVFPPSPLVGVQKWFNIWPNPVAELLFITFTEKIGDTNGPSFNRRLRSCVGLWYY